MIILLSCAACAGSANAVSQPQEETVEPSPRPTIKPNLTRFPTATTLSCSDQTPVHNEWITIYCDNFIDNRNFWESTGSDDLSESAYQIEDGKLVLDFTGTVNQSFLSGVIHWRAVTEADDYVVSVKGKIISDFQNATWGINFCEDANGFYSFMLTNNGAYWLDLYEDDKWVPLVTMRYHSAIKWEEENELTILVDDDQFQFYVNGELINIVQDDSLSGRTISLAIWTAEGVKARFEFDDLVVKEK